MAEQSRTGENIQLHIEELVLHQFAPGERYAIAAALQAELTRLFTVEGVPPDLVRRDGSGRLNGGEFQVPRDAPAAVIGAQLARTLYQNLAATGSTHSSQGGNTR